jgi:hypothetical protein
MTAHHGGSAPKGGSAVTEELRLFAGIDWGSESHQICVIDAAMGRVGEKLVEHSGAGIA